MPPAASDPRLLAFDGLRGLAILAVLFGHLTVYELPPPPAYLALGWFGLSELGARGVDLFFALSGYLIFTRLRLTRTRPGWARDFWVRRAAKILPLYLALLLVVYLLLPGLLAATGFETKLAQQTSAAHDWPWYLGFGSNLLNGWSGHFTNPALDVAWSLAIEVQFYVFAAMLFALRPGGGGVRFWAALACSALAVRLLVFGLGWNWIQIFVFTPARLDAFAAGVLIALFPSRLPAWLRLVGLAGLVACIFPAWSRLSPAGMILGYTWVALGCAALLDIARHSPPSGLVLRVLQSRPLVVCGALSYSLYLTHIPVRAALRDIFLPAVRPLDDPSAWLHQVLFYLGAGLACLLVGAAAWLLIERPAQRFLLRRLAPASTRP